MAFLTSPVGNMVWIWQTPAGGGGDIDAISACARQNNVATVTIKAFDRTRPLRVLAHDAGTAGRSRDQWTRRVRLWGNRGQGAGAAL